MLGMIWVQSVCKGYEQTTLVGNELINPFILMYPIYIDTIRMEYAG